MRFGNIRQVSQTTKTLYSFSAGLGFALSYTPAIAMVGKYFSERKALAYGIALSGSDIFTCLHFSFFSLILYFSHLTCSFFLSPFPPVCIYCVPLCFFQSAFKFLIPYSPFTLFVFYFIPSNPMLPHL